MLLLGSVNVGKYTYMDGQWAMVFFVPDHKAGYFLLFLCFFCWGGWGKGGPLRFSHDGMFFFKSDLKGWVVPLPTNSQHKEYETFFRLGDPKLRLHLPLAYREGGCPPTQRTNHLEVRKKKQNLVARFGI